MINDRHSMPFRQDAGPVRVTVVIFVTGPTTRFKSTYVNVSVPSSTQWECVRVCVWRGVFGIHWWGKSLKLDEKCWRFSHCGQRFCWVFFISFHGDNDFFIASYRRKRILYIILMRPYFMDVMPSSGVSFFFPPVTESKPEGNPALTSGASSLPTNWDYPFMVERISSPLCA